MHKWQENGRLTSDGEELLQMYEDKRAPEEFIKRFPNRPIHSLKRIARDLRSVKRLQEVQPDYIPKILLYDEEVSAPEGRFYGALYKARVIEVTKPARLYSFSYKWLGDKDIQTVMRPDFKLQYKADPEDDTGVVKELHKLMHEADITIAHNNDRFDKAMAFTRFIELGLKPPSPSKSIDTLKAYRKFRFTSNKLDLLGQQLELGRKQEIGYQQLWKACEAGDMEAWKLLAEYNEGDIALLEALYLRVRAYITNHPNLAVYGRGDVCTICGDPRLRRDGNFFTNAQAYEQYQCENCGGWQTYFKADKDIERSEFRKASYN